MSSRRYTIQISTKVPSGWGPWRHYDGRATEADRDKQLHNILNRSGWDLTRFRFRKGE